MRKTTQSMYQSKGPNPSKLNTMIQAYISIKPAQRKVQGHDLLKTTKTNFEQTVTNLKSKPVNKVLEDEYINGLQEQIKYLEYELKLLKDKELIERQGVNQLDNFLKDQIPINENILAMKNKYNATKANLENQFKKLTEQQAEANEVLIIQKNQIDRLHKLVQAHRDQTDGRRRQFKDKISELMKQLSLTKDEYEAIGKDTKRKQDQIKEMSQKIANIQRANEKQKVQEVRMMEQKTKYTIKFQQKTKQTKINMAQSLQKVQEIQALGQTNPLIAPIDQQNSILRKKIMLNQKQKSTAQNIIAEIDLFLKEQEKQRQVERQQKGKLINQTEDYRIQFQHLERYVENLIKQQTIRTKNLMLKQMTNDLKQKEQYYETLTDRLRNLQQQCSDLIQLKKQLQDSIETQIITTNQFQNKKHNLQHSITDNKSKTQSLKRVTQQSGKQIPPLQNDLEKCNGLIPIAEKEIQKKKSMIHHLNKQVDLLKELKTLDMEQLQLISMGGSHVQNVLHQFIKNWEKIKSK